MRERERKAGRLYRLRTEAPEIRGYYVKERQEGKASQQDRMKILRAARTVDAVVAVHCPGIGLSWDRCGIILVHLLMSMDLSPKTTTYSHLRWNMYDWG